MASPPTPEREYQESAAIYAARRAHFGEQRDLLARRSSRNGNLSLTLIAAALAAFGLGLWRASPVLLACAGALALGFAISFTHHGRVNRRLRRYQILWALNDEGLARLQRDWASLPLRQREARSAAELDLANDLDLFGHASLMHLLGTAGTPVGLETLAGWLLRPAPPDTIRGRQAAAAELAPLADFRDEFGLRGRLMETAQPSYEAFARWATGTPWLEQRTWLLWLARILPILTLGGAVAQAGGLTDAPLWAPPLLIGLLLTLMIGRQVDQVIDGVAERQDALRTYADMFQLVGALACQAPLLRRLQEALTAGGVRAEGQMRRLGRLMALADLRGWMFFFVVQITTLWNVHVLWLLEHWQRAAGRHAPAWLAALGETEALIALATLAHDNPGWAFPEVGDDQRPTTDQDGTSNPHAQPPIADEQPATDNDGAVLTARGLGHPLLPETTRVGNDVTIGRPGAFLLVTGSNMSGKSTLLRAIGVNVILAQAGGPVCAAALRLAPAELATSMRVQDSLEQGVSYFMAELQRLKRVVDAAERARASGVRVLLFLLDEILHGTNTAERQIAARRVIHHLLGLGAAGAVSTHDLTLTEDPALAALSQPVHFTETFERTTNGPIMRFDYKLRPGVATSTNALALVAQIIPALADSADTPPAPQSAP